MFPSFEIFGRTYYLFSVMGIIAVFAASGLANLRAKRYGLTYNDVLLGILVLGAGLLIGSSVLNAILRFPFLWERREDISIFMFLRHMFGGMVFYGGLIGAVIATPIYAKVIKRSLSDVIALAVPVFPFAHAIMRVGCFLAGCCYGIAHEMLGVAFTRAPTAPNNINLLPVQLYEAAANLVIFAAVWLFTRKPRCPVHIICMYVMSYAVVRFFLEFLRGDEVRGFIFNLSTSQFISVLMLIAGVCVLIGTKVFRKPAEPTTEES
ncbi:MAG: prolipoprotein diacylglyceryl transferase [Defluviitaleaceae bacterium]|nr:prolipoprotein diacylglyceryl transferase [Defluviitaleaceae bacterium]